jgi:hypothetical protein
MLPASCFLSAFWLFIPVKNHVVAAMIEGISFGLAIRSVEVNMLVGIKMHFIKPGL